ncbi:uncharacterized protein [Drosophila pseudoobscura]|uniref:Uncharacterized protein n=1 Tax=Drosophila pseudoobscura pseudoobscura TaxID=46245 RepID=A0A6I8UDY7_DROPS|nr:uncharacterized protein LOC4813595 [Drosophila pseudoobscura]
MSSIPNRATIRQASVAARQRQSRSHRLTRHTCFTMKRAAIFQVRKSLVEYVDVELTDMETSVFYQRIFILAKNGCLEPEVEALTEVEEPPSSAPEAEKKEPELMAAEEEAPVPLDETTQGSTTEMSLAKAEGTEEATADAPGEGPATPQSAQDPTQRVNAEPEAQAEVVTRTFRFSDEFVQASDAALEDEGEEEEEPEPEPEAESEPEPPKARDYFETFCEKLQELHHNCQAEAFTPDPVCGLFIYMGDYSLLMLEASEDMMGCFCRQLVACSNEFWLSNRVFQTEDHIKHLYTKELTFRRIPGVFLNEKFPTSTPTDEYLMGKQHMIIKEKLLIICRLIAESLAPSEPSPDPDKEQDHHQTVSRVPSRQRFQELEEEREPEKVLSTAASRTGSKAPSVAPSTTPSAVPSTAPIMVPSRAPSVAPSIAASTAASVAGSLKAKSLEQVEFLSVDVYRKFLPEIQRIELVLASTRFYFTLAEFLDLYGTAPQTPDEDGLFWPIQNNYTPPNIFRRTPFDINLTFADYVAAKMKTDDHHRESHLDFDDLEQIPETQQRPPEGDREAGPPAE